MASGVVRIYYKFPSLNEYVNANRSNKFKGAKMKRQIQDDIAWQIKRLPKFTKPVKIDFVWVEPTKRRDPDNVHSSDKFILDALVEQEIIPDDSQKWVKKISHDIINQKEAGVILKITEV